METQTRFDLNAAIENWRSELAAQASLTAEVRRELETHLRDAIAGFQQCGLNDDESFWLARRRVGQPPQLAEKFTKANPAAVWRERVFWIGFAWLIIESGGTASTALIQNCIVLFRNLSSNVAWFTFFSLSVLLFLVPVLAVTIGLVRKQAGQSDSLLTTIFQSRRRFAVSAVLFVLFMGVFSMFLFVILFKTQIIFGSFYVLQELYAAFFNTIRQLMLIPFLVWLLPTPSRKTTKRTGVRSAGGLPA